MNDAIRLTVVIVVGIIINYVQVLVVLEGRLQQLNFLVTFHTFAFCIGLGFFVAIGLIQFGHLVYSLFVLHLHLVLEFELMQHFGDLLRVERCVRLD